MEFVVVDDESVFAHGNIIYFASSENYIWCKKKIIHSLQSGFTHLFKGEKCMVFIVLE